MLNKHDRLFINELKVSFAIQVGFVKVHKYWHWLFSGQTYSNTIWFYLDKELNITDLENYEFETKESASIKLNSYKDLILKQIKTTEIYESKM